jgi:hypothetical protein
MLKVFKRLGFSTHWIPGGTSAAVLKDKLGLLSSTGEFQTVIHEYEPNIRQPPETGRSIQEDLKNHLEGEFGAASREAMSSSSLEKFNDRDYGKRLRAGC